MRYDDRTYRVPTIPELFGVRPNTTVKLQNLLEITDLNELKRILGLNTSRDLSRTNLEGKVLNTANNEMLQLINFNFKSAMLGGATLNNTNLSRSSMENVDFTDGSLVGSDLTRVRITEADFVGTDLTNATLVDITEGRNVFFNSATLENTNFTDSTLPDSIFDGAILNNTNFTNTHLKRANFEGVQMLGTANFTDSNLEGAIFRNVDLRNVNFEGAKLSGVNFAGANLSGINFAGADLAGANFEGADLTGVDLSDLNLRGTSFLDAILTDTSFQNSILEDAIFENSIYLRDANFEGAILNRANLRGADLTDANLTFTELRGADLTDAILISADLGHAFLTDANLTHANLSSADLRDVDFRGADLTGADLTGADLRDVDSRGANLTDVDFRGAVLTRIDFRDANLTNANFSEATINDINILNATTTGAVFDEQEDSPPIVSFEEIKKAIRTNNLTKLLELINSNRAYVTVENELGETPLYMAAYFGRLKMVSHLVDNGAVIDHVEPRAGWNALHIACAEGKTDVVEYFIQKGADLNMQTNYRETPLIIACRKNDHDSHLEIIKMLLAAGVDITLEDVKGRNALFYAEEKDNEELIKILTDILDVVDPVVTLGTVTVNRNQIPQEANDFVNMEDVNIQTFLGEDPNNKVIKVGENFYATNGNDIQRQFLKQKEKNNYIYYPCKKVLQYALLIEKENVHIDKPIFSASYIVGVLSDFVLLKEVKAMVRSEHQYFEIITDGPEVEHIPANASAQMLTIDRNAVSANHCQEGKEGKILKLKMINIVEEAAAATEVNDIKLEEEPTKSPSKKNGTKSEGGKRKKTNQSKKIKINQKSKNKTNQLKKINRNRKTRKN